MRELYIALRFNQKRLFESILAALGILIGLSAFVGASALMRSYKAGLEKMLEQPASLILRVEPRRLTMSDTSAVEPFQEAMPRFQFSKEDSLAIVQENQYVKASFQYSRRMYSTSETFTGGAMMGPPENGPDAISFGQSQEAANVSTNDTPLLERVSAYEVTEAFFDSYMLNLVKGMAFDDKDIERGNLVALAGSTIAGQLFKDGEALGKKIKLNGVYYTIIGVVNDPFGETYGNDDLNTSLYIPQNLQENQGFQPFRSLNFKIDKSSDIANAEALLLKYFDKTYGADSVTITGQYRRIRSEVEKRQSVLYLALLLSAICILASLFNIVNIINNRVNRRLKTYAIMRTTGAKLDKILSLIIAEIFFIVAAGSLGSFIAAPMIFKFLETTLQSGSAIKMVLSMDWIGAILTTLVTGFGVLAVSSLATIRLKNLSIVSILRSE